MEYIRNEELESAFAHEYRHYLAGHLTREQPFLRHLEDEIEIGISDYQSFTADRPHCHPIATEHGYVLRGSIKIRCFEETGTTEMEFREGDFFLIRPGVCYASKNAPGTRILFIKSPGGNDKRLIQVDSDTEEWLKAW